MKMSLRSVEPTTTFTDIQVPPSDGGGGEAALPPCAVFATADRATSCGQLITIKFVHRMVALLTSTHHRA
jgi:hypothetical protein